WTALVVFLLAVALSPPTPYVALIVDAARNESSRWRLVLDALGTWALPLLLLASAGTALLGRVVSDLAGILSSAPSAEVNAWEHFVGLLERSDSARHRRQIFVGLHATEGYPVFLPIPILQQHAHILGSTGTGKTSLVVLPFVTQLIRRAEHAENA